MSPKAIDPALHKRAPVKPIILRSDARQRFMRRFTVVGDCWIWSGAPTSTGYGVFNQGRGQRHRVAYALFKGEVPVDKQIDHLCRNRICVNPEHLELVTNRENVERAPWTAVQVQASKTRCPAGHAYDEANTYRYNGERHCRACQREAARRRYVPSVPITHCKRGHEFTPDNTYLADGRRTCRECRRVRQEAYREKKRRDLERGPHRIVVEIEDLPAAVVA